MKLIFIFIFILNYNSLFAKSANELMYDLEHMNNKQIINIIKAYDFGKKYDLQWTLAAITWQESEGGLLKIDRNLNKFGLCKLDINEHLKMRKIKSSFFSRSEYATKLIEDDFYNLKWTVKKILKLKKNNKGWFNIWGAFNSNYYPNLKYASNIYDKIQILKKYMLKYHFITKG